MRGPRLLRRARLHGVGGDAAHGRQGHGPGAVHGDGARDLRGQEARAQALGAAGGTGVGARGVEGVVDLALELLGLPEGEQGRGAVLPRRLVVHGPEGVAEARRGQSAGVRRAPGNVDPEALEACATALCPRGSQRAGGLGATPRVHTGLLRGPATGLAVGPGAKAGLPGALPAREPANARAGDADLLPAGRGRGRALPSAASVVPSDLWYPGQLRDVSSPRSWSGGLSQPSTLRWQVTV